MDRENVVMAKPYNFPSVVLWNNELFIIPAILNGRRRPKQQTAVYPKLFRPAFR